MARANKHIIGFTALALVAGLAPRYSPCAELARHEVHVSIEKGPNGSHVVFGWFAIDISSRAAWKILSDYDRLGAYVSSVNLSRKIRYDNGQWYVEQMMSGKAGPFHKTIHLFLEVEEIIERKIAFRDVSGKSFKSYEGSWEILNADEGIQVLYKLRAAPAFFAPGFIATGAFKRSVALLLMELRDEMIAQNKI